MLLGFGLFLVAAGVLLAAAAALVARNSNAPGWARIDMVHDLAAFAVTGLMAFGAGYLVNFAARLAEQPFALGDGALAVVVLAGFVAIWMSLGVRRRLRAYDDRSAALPASAPQVAFVGAADLGAANDDRPFPGPKPVHSGARARGRGRKRAA